MIVDMVITDQMQHPVHDQMSRMIGDRNPLLRGLAHAGFARQHDVAEQYLAIVAVCLLYTSRCV